MQSYCSLKPPRFLEKDLYGVSVILRADFNISNNYETDENSLKLKSIFPTLKALQNKGAKTLIISHKGRPKNFEEGKKRLSLQYLTSKLNAAGFKTSFANDIAQAETKLKNLQNGEFVLLENIRFWPEEKELDKGFAHKLKDLAVYYINDAWGTLHRNETTISFLPELYGINCSSIGLLVEKELSNLHWFKSNAPKPTLILLAGAKAQTKLPLAANLIKWADLLLLAPTLSFAFELLKLDKSKLGKGFEKFSNLIPVAERIVIYSQKTQKELILPVDYQATKNSNFSGPYFQIHQANTADQNSDFYKNDIYITTLGEKSIKLFEKALLNAGSIFINGISGFSQCPQTEMPYKTLLQTVAQSSAYTVIGGGDSVAAVYRYGFEKTINFCSTGGGSTLAYLANEPLPGLNALCKP